MIHDHGIQHVEIPMKKTLFKRALRAQQDGQPREVKRIVAGQYGKIPRFDPDDILELLWEKAPKKLQKEPGGYAVIAKAEVARGQRVLAEFIMDHDHSLGHSMTLTYTTGEPGNCITFKCPTCNVELILRKRSLRGTSVPEEARRREKM